jgi:SAM-dependent methyltransferase
MHRPPDDARDRFSSRVDDYVKYRPSYPSDLIALLEREAGLRKGSRVADLGSGTGILTTLLLDAGAEVFAVEPNAPMREAAERALGDRAAFHSVAASAEATTLPDASVDLVTAAQAFHWFDPIAARREMARIVRPGGAIAIVWNARKLGGTPFLDAYEALLQRFGTDYGKVRHDNVGDAGVRAFAAPSEPSRFLLPNAQVLDFDGLRGRLLSSSFTPEPGHPGHAPMLAELARVFEQHAEDGAVTIVYDTTVYIVHLSA